MTYPGSFHKLSSHGTNAAPENGADTRGGARPESSWFQNIWWTWHMILFERGPYSSCMCLFPALLNICLNGWWRSSSWSINTWGSSKKNTPKTHTVDLGFWISHIMVSSPMRTVKRGLDVSPILAWLWLKLWSRDSLLMFWRFFKNRKSQLDA